MAIDIKKMNEIFEILIDLEKESMRKNKESMKNNKKNPDKQSNITVRDLQSKLLSSSDIDKFDVADFLKSILKQLVVKDKEKEIKDKEKEIKEKEIKDKEKEIKDKEKEIKDKEKEIKKKHLTIILEEDEILDEEVGEKEKLLNEKEKLLSEKKAALSSIILIDNKDFYDAKNENKLFDITFHDPEQLFDLFYDEYVNAKYKPILKDSSVDTKEVLDEFEKIIQEKKQINFKMDECEKSNNKLIDMKLIRHMALADKKLAKIVGITKIPVADLEKMSAFRKQFYKFDIDEYLGKKPFYGKNSQKDCKDILGLNNVNHCLINSSLADELANLILTRQQKIKGEDNKVNFLKALFPKYDNNNSKLIDNHDTISHNYNVVLDALIRKNIMKNIKKIEEEIKDEWSTLDSQGNKTFKKKEYKEKTSNWFLKLIGYNSWWIARENKKIDQFNEKVQKLDNLKKSNYNGGNVSIEGKITALLSHKEVDFKQYQNINNEKPEIKDNSIIIKSGDDRIDTSLVQQNPTQSLQKQQQKKIKSNIN